MSDECKCEKGAPKWVVTFGDMMSLLLCFFVLLLSFSTTDIIKYRKLTGSVKDAFGMAPTIPTATNPAADLLVHQNIQVPKTFAAMVALRAKGTSLAHSSSSLEMEAGADWVRLRMEGDALFDPGSFTVKPEAHADLDTIGDFINEFEGSVTITGHTDGSGDGVRHFAPGTYLANYEMGLQRAVAVLGYLAKAKGVDPSIVIPTSKGDSKPRETNNVEAGRSRNRRVEFEFKTSNQDQVEASLGGGAKLIRPGQEQ